jgi:hypothetical protein
MHLQTQIDIQATPQQVWDIMTRFSDYPQWNPFIKSLTGEVAEGNRIRVELMGMSFKPKVLAFRQKEEFRWKGQFIFPGLFDGEHYFRLSAKADGTTRLEHGEYFSGLLVPLFKRRMLADTEANFRAFNEALKQECEKPVQTSV